jgi:hypothetical protein
LCTYGCGTGCRTNHYLSSGSEAQQSLPQISYYLDTAVNEAKFISKAIKLGVQDVLIKEELSAELMINTIVQLVKKQSVN